MASKVPGKGIAPVSPALPKISHDRAAELKEAFFVLDSSGSGSVSAEDVKSLLSSIVSTRLTETFDDFMKECGIDPTEPITFAQFFVLAVRLAAVSSLADVEVANEPTAESMFAAFAPFDPADNGYVDSTVFFCLMGEKENKLSQQEQEELRLRLERVGHMKKGRVYYKAFILNLLATNANTPFF